MRKYELALVLTEEMDMTPLLLKVKGKIIKTNVLGMRQLAYQIKKAVKGWYVILEIELLETSVKELEKLLKENEKVLRSLLVRAD